MLRAVSDFRTWAAAYPSDQRSGEWECDYANWANLHAAVLEFVAAKPFAAWSAEETRAVLYALARDNEIEYLAREIADHHRELVVPLARSAIEHGERDDRCQLAEQLGRIGRAGGPEEDVLLVLVRDEHEYVRRMALGALARIGSPCLESEALRAWDRADADQEWARMMSLWCLHRVGSPMLERLLGIAVEDPREHLRAYAKRMRRGEVDR